MMPRLFNHARLIAFFLLMVTSAMQSAHAEETLRSLLMPGPVSKVHEKYEHDCDQCHDAGDKERQGNLCIKCHSHENILDDISTKTGYHGRLPDDLKDNCKHCHTEHKGRDAVIIQLNATTFDHSKTDFKLKGMHVKTACSSCHKPDKKYAQAPGNCYACHKKDDFHAGKQGEKCEDCHSATGWKKTAFDHDKTDFPLIGVHKKTSCDSCHVDQKYKDTPVACVACHKINDVHKGGYGDDCKNCHTPEKWKNARFDHDKTDFPLVGVHKTTGCNDCHTSGNMKKEVPKDCFGCHKNDDSHKGRYGEKCGDCHKPTEWAKSKFDHDKTDFPLKGRHTKLVCIDCHKGKLDEKIKIDCITCHEIDDVHKGKQGKQCDKCHNEEGWKSGVNFDHDLTDFPLIGMHATAACDECHLTTEYNSTSSDCNFCHAADDVHKTLLGTDCHTCHNPNSWKNWLFDHDKATNFKIDGAHKELGCYDCHTTKSNGKLSASGDCIACHRRDDIHNRQFGRHCDQCHTTKNFKDVTINR